MNKTNLKLEEIREFLRNAEGVNKNELITDILGEIPLLKEYSADEIGLYRDEEWLTDLDTFTNRFYDGVIERVVNAIGSFKS